MTRWYPVDDLAPVGATGRMWAVGSYETITGEHTAEQYDLIERSRG